VAEPLDAPGSPTVSVVVIFRDEGQFLAEAIESVLGQTSSEWELLLVDDGSTDESPEIAQRHARARPDRIRYLEHPGHENRGMSASRNLGIREARGRYLAFLDGDDVWFPQTLSEQMAILESHPEAAMAYGRLQYWFSWNGDGSSRDYVEPLGVSPDCLLEPPGPLPLFLRDRAAVPSGLMVRTAAAGAVGGFEDAFRGEYEDQVFLAKICLAYSVYAAGSCWYRYRQHPRSSVAVGLRSGATDAARLTFLRWLDDYLDTHRAPSWRVRWALRIERWRFSRPRAYHLMWQAERILALVRARASR
jgi:glycosyltransferase involved in cell wall biosynthesis